MIYALKAGYGRKGAKIGSGDGEAGLFRADMLAFWRRTLGDDLRETIDNVTAMLSRATDNVGIRATIIHERLNVCFALLEVAATCAIVGLFS